MKQLVKITYEYSDGSKVSFEPGKMPARDYNPLMPDIYKTPVDYTSCSKCGIKLEGVMGYCCPYPKCPTGLGGGWC